MEDRQNDNIEDQVDLIVEESVRYVEEESEAKLIEDDDDEWTWESYSDPVVIQKPDLKSPKRVPTHREQIGTAAKTFKPSTPAILHMDIKKNTPKKTKAEFSQAKKEYARALEIFEEEEKQRLILEAIEIKQKEKKETNEQAVRVEQLTVSTNAIDQIVEQNVAICVQNTKDAEWEEYMKCDGLPNPYECGELNTYLHLWDQVILSTTIDEAVERTGEVLKLIERVQELIDDATCIKHKLLDNWNWIRLSFQQYQQKSLDTATYILLRNVEKNLNRLNLTTADYRKQEKDLAFCLWVLITMPTPMPNPRRPTPPPIELRFPEMSMDVSFPPGLNCKLLAVRAMYLKYDHLSGLCKTYQDPSVPEQYKPNLLVTTSNEWRNKLIYKYNGAMNLQKNIPLTDLPKEKRLQPLDPNVETIPVVPYSKLEPTASVAVITAEKDAFVKLREELRLDEEEGVLNLRRYLIIGGTYFLNLFYQPPQPQSLVTFVMDITNLMIPTCLYEVPYHMEYTAPKQIDTSARRDPEEIEAEMKLMEQAMEKLIFVTLTLPTHVMWLDIPIVCWWDKKRKAWVNTDIHDMKHVEEKGYVTFRTGRFGTFGIAINRFSNFPFQAWEIKPEKDGSVTLQITAAILMIEFNIKECLICMTQVQNGPNETYQDLIGIYYKFRVLVRILRDGGADFFPGFDTFSYVENTCEKHWPMERHVYYNMAQLSAAYNFTWSRWNYSAGRRSIVMQMREYKPERSKQVLYSTLLITPLRAKIIDCTEISQEFNDAALDNAFYADLFYLTKCTGTLYAKTKIANSKIGQVGTVADLLMSTRVLSLS